MAGLLIAAYQMGYGLAAFGIGPLQDKAGVGLPPIFGYRSRPPPWVCPSSRWARARSRVVIASGASTRLPPEP